MCTVKYCIPSEFVIFTLRKKMYASIQMELNSYLQFSKSWVYGQNILGARNLLKTNELYFSVSGTMKATEQLSFQSCVVR